MILNLALVCAKPKKDQIISKQYTIGTMARVLRIGDNVSGTTNEINASSELFSGYIISNHSQYQRTQDIYNNKNNSNRSKRNTNYEACPGLRTRAMCPWSYSFRTNSSWVQNRLQVATCASSIPRFLPHRFLSTIRCEEMFQVQIMTIANCVGSQCNESVRVPVGCIPVIPCVVQV